MKSSLNLNYAAQKEHSKSTRDLLELYTLVCNTTTPVWGSQFLLSLKDNKKIEAPISLIGFCFTSNIPVNNLIVMVLSTLGSPSRAGTVGLGDTISGPLGSENPDLF